MFSKQKVSASCRFFPLKNLFKDQPFADESIKLVKKITISWKMYEKMRTIQVTRKMGISTKFEDNVSYKKNGDRYKI